MRERCCWLTMTTSTLSLLIQSASVPSTSLQDHLYSFARIRIHGGTTQVWNRGGTRPSGCNVLEHLPLFPDLVCMVIADALRLCQGQLSPVVGPRFGQDPPPSHRQHWRTHSDNGNAIFDFGRRRHRRKEPAGEMAHGRCVGEG